MENVRDKEIEIPFIEALLEKAEPEEHVLIQTAEYKNLLRTEVEMQILVAVIDKDDWRASDALKAIRDARNTDWVNTIKPEGDGNA